MDRQEFSAMVKAARERKGISRYQVSWDSRLTAIQVLRIERAENSFKMDNLFKFLDVCQLRLSVTKGKTNIYFTEYNDIVQYLEDNRNKNSLTNYRICKDINISVLTLTNVINKKSVVSIDTFLKLTNYFGYTLSIVDKEE